MSWEGCFRESLAIRLSGIPQEVQVQSLPLQKNQVWPRAVLVSDYWVRALSQEAKLPLFVEILVSSNLVNGIFY